MGHMTLATITETIILVLNSSPRDKMAAISQTIFWDALSWMKSVFFLCFFRGGGIKISSKCVAKGPIDNNPALV